MADGSSSNLKKEQDALLDRGEKADQSIQSSAKVSDDPPLAKINCSLNKPCPSCGVDTNLSRAKSVLSHIGPTGTLKDFNSVIGMGSVRSHSILAQSVIRKVTRRKIKEFMSREGLGESACALLAKGVWEDFSKEYHDALLNAAKGPMEDLTSHFEKMKREAVERKGTLDQLKKLEDDWKKEQKMLEQGKAIEIDEADLSKDIKQLLFQYTAEIQEAAAIANGGLSINDVPVPKPVKGAVSEAPLKDVLKVGESVLKILVKRDEADIRKDLELAKQGSFVDVPTMREVALKVKVKAAAIVAASSGGPLNKDQFERYKDFRSKFKGPKPEFGSRKIDDKVSEIFAKVAGDNEESFVIYREELNELGTVLRSTQETIIDGSSKGVEELSNASVATTWKDQIFDNLMMKPFLDESQCRYCEDVQKDYSLLQRAQYARTHVGTPENFVGKHLATKIGPDSPEAFVSNWLNPVVDKLKEKVQEQCTQETKPKAAAKVAKPPLPEKERDEEIVRQLAPISPGTVVNVAKVAVEVSKALGKVYDIDARAVKEAIARQLDAEGKKK